MNKRKLVAEVARKTDYAKWEINAILKPLCESILTTLQNGEKVIINEFGTFDLKIKKERVWVDPKTKKRKIIPAKVQVVGSLRSIRSLYFHVEICKVAAFVERQFFAFGILA